MYGFKEVFKLLTEEEQDALLEVAQNQRISRELKETY